MSISTQLFLINAKKYATWLMSAGADLSITGEICPLNIGCC